VHLYYIHWTNLKAPLVLPQRFPDDGTLGVPKHVREYCALIVFIS